MSILAVAADSVSRVNLDAVLPWLLICLFAMAGASVTGLFRARAVSGPYRVSNVSWTIFRLLFAAAVSCFAWFSAQVIYFAVRKAMQPGVVINEANLSATDWAFLSTAPQLFGFMVALIADVSLLGGPSQLERLGLNRHPLPGALRGVVGILLAWPMVFLVSLLTEWCYQARHYIHPQEHVLLKMMGDTTNPIARTALIIGAVIMAPLFEETIFRGHIQTFFRQLFCRLSGALPATEAASAPTEFDGTLSYAVPVATTDDPGVPSRPVAWQTWAAIFIASALFTSIHPRWMWPPIFFLAVCLGYAYERTGSLWTSIVMHALFNATSTYLFLNQAR